MPVCHENENVNVNTINANLGQRDLQSRLPSKGGFVDMGALKQSNATTPGKCRAFSEVSTQPSMVNDDSRLAQLARPPSRKFAPSQAELQKMYMEKQQKKMAEQRLQNEKSMRTAIDIPQTGKTVTPRGVTVPREFNLSRSNTPSQSRCTTPARSRSTTPARSRCTTPGRSVYSDADSAYSSSRRGRTPSKRELTVAHGPNLRTALRPRSLSQNRSSDRDRSARSESWREQNVSGKPLWRPVSRSNSRHSFRSACSQRGMVTPRRSSRVDASVDSISSDMDLSVPPSACSKMSRSVRSNASRWSELSQRSRSSSRPILSTEEIEELRIAAKRVEVKEMMRQNAQRGRRAIQCPTPIAHRSLSLTVPKEFNLSCPVTPSRSVSQSILSDNASDCDERPWLRSLRSVPASPSAGTWHPELTVPHAPVLRTEQRSRSSSVHRATHGSRGSRSMSRHKLPREQAAIERHLDRAVAASATVSSMRAMPEAAASNKPSWNDSTYADDLRTELPKDDQQDLDEWVRAAETAEERARRGRLVAERRHREKADEKGAKLKCFTGARFQPRSRATGRPAADTKETNNKEQAQISAKE